MPCAEGFCLVLGCSAVCDGVFCRVGRTSFARLPFAIVYDTLGYVRGGGGGEGRPYKIGMDDVPGTFSGEKPSGVACGPVLIKHGHEARDLVAAGVRRIYTRERSGDIQRAGLEAGSAAVG